MNLRLLVLRIGIPQHLKLEKLHSLMILSAEALRQPLPELQEMNLERSRELFVQLLLSGTTDSNQNEEAHELSGQTRLETAGKLFGLRLRCELRIKTPGEARTALRLLYRALGIDLCFDRADSITVSRCWFARYFTPETCKLVSALDRGVVNGLTDGGELVFTSRLTEGECACHATIKWRET